MSPRARCTGRPGGTQSAPGRAAESAADAGIGVGTGEGVCVGQGVSVGNGAGEVSGVGVGAGTGLRRAAETPHSGQSPNRTAPAKESLTRLPLPPADPAA
jgi:hypothetical protein